MKTLANLIQTNRVADILDFTDKALFLTFIQENKLTLINDVWEIALKIYSITENRTMLLNLQDHQQQNVNDILLAAFCDLQKKQLPDQFICKEQIHWRKAIIAPLRAIRVTAKASETSEVYAKLKKIELMAEQIDIAFLHKLYLTLPLLNHSNQNDHKNKTNLARYHLHLDAKSLCLALLDN